MFRGGSNSPVVNGLIESLIAPLRTCELTAVEAHRQPGRGAVVKPLFGRFHFTFHRDPLTVYLDPLTVHIDRLTVHLDPLT
eukprot:8888511-Pyramimonas_sp.AAC.1